MVTVITKTIGSGRDYASFTLAEADVENIATLAFGSTDLVASDGAIVFEAAAGTYSDSVTFDSTLTSDAARNVTYKPAAGSEHGGVFGAGVVLHDNGAGYGGAQTIRNGYIVLDGLEVHVSNTSGFRTGVSLDPTNDMFGVKLRNMLLWSQTSRAPLGVSTAAVYDMGSLADPIVYENCVFRKTDNFADLAGAAAGAGKNGHFVVANCTFVGDSAATHRALAITALGTLNVQITNCMSFVPWQWYQSVSGTLNLTGSNNFGGSTQPLPAAIQGSPYPITPTTSFSTPLGSGDYAVYMGATGALADVTGNDVWQQGVGPSVNSDVPTTDINGVARSGAACNPGAFEADGFVAPTTITKTIGPNPPSPAPPEYDYGSFTLAEADVENIGGSADLTFENERIVFEADAGTYTEPSTVTIDSSLTCDPTRNVTYQSADLGQAIVSSPTTAAVFKIANGAFTTLRGLKIVSTGTGASVRGVEIFPNGSATCEGCVLDSLILQSLASVNFTAIELQLEPTGLSGGAGSASHPTVIRNCVDLGIGNGLGIVGNKTDSIHARIANCTFAGSGPSAALLQTANDVTIDVVNCINLGHNWSFRDVFTTGAVTTTGSNNFGGSSNPWPVATQGSPYPITPSTAYDPGAGDYALYVGKNGALLDSPNNDVIGQGVGPDVNSSVPRTDILGNTRYGANANPGAFEVPQATTVLTRTIGPNPAFPEPPKYDYGSFTLAEADVTNIPTSTDLVNENEAIVFEADAGTYSESVTFSSSLTTDATRNVTYKPAAGSEHGGSVLAGVRFVRDGTGENGPLIYDDDTILDGLVVRLELLAQHLTCFQILGQNITLRNCVSRNGDGITATNGSGFVMTGNNDGARLENCVAIGPYQGFKAFSSASLGTIASTIVNCTHAPPTTNSWGYFAPGSGTTLNLTLINNLKIETGSTGAYRTAGSGTVNASGSNNFGGLVNPFPVAIQGSPYPVTATTDTDPGPGDWAIYDADTYALIDDPDNDVLGGGVGPDVNLDVPTTDIRGIPRTGSTTDPGAFVLPPVEQDTWTPVMVRRNDPVDVYGVLTFGDAYINAVEDTLSVTGADGTDATPAIPIGTRALWIQLVSQTGASAGETCDVSIEVSASQSLTLATLSGASTAVGNVPGLMQFPVDCLGQNDPDTPAYPRVKMVTGSSVGVSDVVTVRVVAICGKQTNTTWS